MKALAIVVGLPAGLLGLGIFVLGMAVSVLAMPLVLIYTWAVECGVPDLLPINLDRGK